MADILKGDSVKRYTVANSMREQANLSEIYTQESGTDITFPESKKNVDEIIANSAHSTKESIKYIIKFGVEDGPDGFSMTTRNQFSYDQFTNWRLGETERMAVLSSGRVV